MSRPHLEIPFQIHASVEARDLIPVAIEHQRGPFQEFAEPPFLGLAPSRVIDVGVYIRVEAVLMRVRDIPGRRWQVFDEADALFGKRSEVHDSHDRYANIEISYLLQKMEEYEGISILASNLRQNMDESFIRRLAFTVLLPFPDVEDRYRIWTRMWPAGTPLSRDLNLSFIADRFKFSGGNIK